MHTYGSMLSASMEFPPRRNQHLYDSPSNKIKHNTQNQTKQKRNQTTTRTNKCEQLSTSSNKDKDIDNDLKY